MNRSFQKIFEIYVFAFSFFFAARPLSDGDFWWHLKTGQYIIQNRTIPKVDLYSFTNYGKPWVAHEWLSEVIFYIVYSRLGFNSLIFIFAVLTALAFWIAFRRSNSHPFIGGAAALLGVWTVIPTIGVRPRVFTLLLASVYLALLVWYARRGEGRAVWWLVPLTALWVNLHAGFLIGLVLISLTIIGIPLDALASGERLGPLWARFRTLGFVLLGCLLVVMLNPHGPRIYTFPFEIFFSPIQQKVVVDWISPDFHEPELLPLALLILLTISAFALSPKRVRPSELLLFVTTLYATLKSNRHMSIFAVTAAPLLADYFQNWLTSTSFGKTFDETHSSNTHRWTSILFSGLLLLPLLAFAAKLKSTVFAAPGQEVIQVPLKAVEYLKEKQITGNTFTNPNIWGGYLIWALPSNTVYIDGRSVYPDEFLKEYLGIIWGVTDWREPFDRYKVQIVIVEPKSVLGRELKDSSDWNEVFRDDMAVVFTRR